MSIQTELKKVGTFLVTEITKELAKKDKKASGKLLKSIHSEIEQTSEGFEIAVYAETYFKFIDRGVNGRQRGRGSQYSFRNKKPPVKPLLDWVKQRGLETGDKEATRAAFAIQNHIFKNGIKGINFLDKFLESGVDSSLDKLGDVFVQQISTKIDKI